MKTKHGLIVALDVETYRKATRLVSKLSKYVKIFKVGNILFTRYGPKIVNYIHKKGGKVFLDLKYHDIPNTVSGAAVQATRLGVYMLNVHASSGEKALALTAKKVAEEAKKLKMFKPILVAVTVLTSMNEEDLRPLGVKGGVKGLVLRLANMAKKSGFDGIIASSRETKMIRKKFGENFVIVTPGIRPKWAETNDQKRITTPIEAMQNGSDFIVVGRPITGAKKPIKAVKKILEEIN